ncbi:uncharacterized protein LOC142564485 [Dermacentor variabilis]|uniref:uncharacterized protein LOC142564485 n=1 Tax=Dermacentor variabilis TaxID=34621 RepID=UPI003F5B3846
MCIRSRGHRDKLVPPLARSSSSPYTAGCNATRHASFLQGCCRHWPTASRCGDFGWQKSGRRPATASPATSVDDSRLSRASRTTLFTALLIPCVVIGIIALLLMRAQPKGRHAKHALWIEQLANACATVDCQNAVWEVSASIDVFADPCKDFYGFACGRWANASYAAGDDARRHNYMAIQRRAYVAAVNASLLKMSRPGSSMLFNSTAQHMVRVYRSCLNFFDEEPVNLRETLRASGIRLPFWTAVTTFEDLFAVAVKHALFYNMTTAIDIRWARDPSNVSSYGTLEIAPGMSMVQHMGSFLRRSFINRALPIITNGSSTDEIDALEGIDDALAASSSTCSQTEVTEMSLRELDTPTTNWSRIVGEYARLTGGNEPPSSARVSNLPDVRVILDLLAKSSLPDLKIYLMLVPMSQFFVLEDDVQHGKLAVVDDAGENAAKYETCVRALELLFGYRYRLWVSTHVHRPGTAADVHRIREDVMQATRTLIQSLRNIPTEYHDMSAPPTGYGASYPGSTIPSSQQSGELAALPSEYSDDFVSNVIFFSQKSSYGRRSRCEPFITRESLIMEWTDRETFIRLLVPDFYHPEATEVAVNYATVGYFLGEQTLQAELPKNWNASEYGSCMASDRLEDQLGLVRCARGTAEPNGALD